MFERLFDGELIEYLFDIKLTSAYTATTLNPEGICACGFLASSLPYSYSL